MRLTLFAVLATVAFASTARADVIDQIKTPFETSTVAAGGVGRLSMLDTFSSAQFGLAYDNFTFGSNQTLTQIDWIGLYDGDSSTDNGNGDGGFLTDPDDINPSFTISIYADNIITPNTPGSPALASFNVGAGLSNETLVTPVGLEEHFYSYSAPVNFAATAGTQYWVSISGELDYDENGWSLALSTGTPDGDNFSVNDFGGTRFTDNGDYAIRLTSVPEPSSACALALVGMGLVLRRRRQLV